MKFVGKLLNAILILSFIFLVLFFIPSCYRVWKIIDLAVMGVCGLLIIVIGVFLGYKEYKGKTRKGN